MGVVLMVLSLFIFAAIGVPLAYTLGASGLAYFLIEKPDFLNVFAQRVWSGTNSFIIIALPLFVLAGELMNRGGITKRVIDFSLLLVRPLRGGLGEVNVVASMIFGGISGSSVADTSAIGSVLIPEMEKRGYGRKFTTGITVASSTIGIIIPPSIPMLIYAMASSESVGSLFLAGLIPGVLVGVTQLIVCNIISRKRSYLPEKRKITFKEIYETGKNGILAILMPLFIVCSITFGIATPTESAGIAVLYSLVLGFLVYKELTIKDLVPILKRTLVTSSSVMLIIGFTMIFTWVLAIEQIPTQIGNFFMELQMGKFWILLVLDILVLIMGTMIDVGPAILLLTPIMLPVMQNFGMSNLQFGIILVVGLAIGLVTPPVGMCLNACTKVNKMPLMDVFEGAIPFLLCNVFILLLVTYIPEIVTWLPSVLIK
jgi:tripartite ATP-independent transporter DctM subunit